MLKMNMRTFTQSKCFSAFCLAISVSACFTGSAQAASFSGEVSLGLALPKSIPGVLGIINESIPRPPHYSSTGSGTATASESFPTFTSDTGSYSATISGSTDSIAPGSAQAQSVPVNLGFNAYNLTDHDLNIEYIVSYKYNISSSVSQSGLDQASAQVSIGGQVVSIASDSVTGNESKGPISNDVTEFLTLHPSQYPIGIGFGANTSGQANTVVPAPSSALSTLAFGAVSAGYLLRRQLKKQKLASGDKSVV